MIEGCCVCKFLVFASVPFISNGLIDFILSPVERVKELLVSPPLYRSKFVSEIVLAWQWSKRTAVNIVTNAMEF